MSRSILDLVVLGFLGARWAHLARTSDAGDWAHELRHLEWQVIGLGASYAAAFILWAVGAVAGALQPVSLSAVVGTSALTVGASLRIAGQRALGPAFSWHSWPRADRLVTSGVYRWLRHPLLLGYALETVGLLLAGDTNPAVGFAVVGVLGISLAGQIVREQRALLVRFGDEWREYARARWL